MAERWIEALLQLKELTADAASAIAQIGARTDDPARDVSESIAAAAAARLLAAGWESAAEKLTAVVATTTARSRARVRRDLPEGLSLVDGAVTARQEHFGVAEYSDARPQSSCPESPASR